MPCSITSMPIIVIHFIISEFAHAHHNYPMVMVYISIHYWFYTSECFEVVYGCTLLQFLYPTDLLSSKYKIYSFLSSLVLPTQLLANISHCFTYYKVSSTWSHITCNNFMLAIGLFILIYRFSTNHFSWHFHGGIQKGSCPGIVCILFQLKKNLHIPVSL